MEERNLNDIASELATAEGLGKSVGVAQVKEILGLLGARWRDLTPGETLAEVCCLVQRGGKRSSHRADPRENAYNEDIHNRRGQTDDELLEEDRGE